jgi:hypothetical protein
MVIRERRRMPTIWREVGRVMEGGEDDDNLSWQYMFAATSCPLMVKVDS